jgi:hypothetical protein
MFSADGGWWLTGGAKLSVTTAGRPRVVAMATTSGFAVRYCWKALSSSTKSSVNLADVM